MCLLPYRTYEYAIRGMWMLSSRFSLHFNHQVWLDPKRICVCVFECVFFFFFSVFSYECSIKIGCVDLYLKDIYIYSVFRSIWIEWVSFANKIAGLNRIKCALAVATGWKWKKKRKEKCRRTRTAKGWWIKWIEESNEWRWKNGWKSRRIGLEDLWSNAAFFAQANRQKNNATKPSNEPTNFELYTKFTFV